jgi:hypothetical protein
MANIKSILAIGLKCCTHISVVRYIYNKNEWTRKTPETISLCFNFVFRPMVKKYLNNYTCRREENIKTNFIYSIQLKKIFELN